MTATIPIDLTNLTGDVTSSKGSYKNSSDNSSFENVLSDANKNYTNEPEIQTKNKETNENIDSNKTDETKPDKEKTDAENTENTVKETSQEKENAEVKNEDSAEKPKENQSETDEITEQNPENNQEAEKPAEDSLATNTVLLEDNAEAEDAELIKNSEETHVEYTPENKEQEKMETLTSNLENQQKNVDEIPEPKVNPQEKQVETEEVSEETTEVLEETAKVQTDEEPDEVSKQVNFETILQNTQELDETKQSSQESDTSTQMPETPVDSKLNTQQQGDSVVNVNNDLTEPSTNVEPKNNNEQVQQAMPNAEFVQQDVKADSDPVSQKPLMETATQNSNTADVKENENVDKAPVNQDIISKTNAKVVNVETSNSSNSNMNNSFSGQQNAQEQAIKFEVEKNTAAKDIPNNNLVEPPKNADIASEQFNTNTQSDFSNNLQSAQAQNQANVPQGSKELSNEDIISQINKQLSFKNVQTEGTTRINMVLNPENLGKVSLELINSKDGLVAQMVANSEQVREILNDNLENLKDSLIKQGVNVNTVTVKVAETQDKSTDMSSFENQMGEQQNQQNSNTKKSDEEFSFENEYSPEGDITEEAEELETAETVEIKAESSARISSHLGQIDYKV